MVCLATLMLCVASAAGSLQGKLANIGFVEYSAEQIDCAACEAVAQALEKAMSSGAHLGKDSRARPAKTRGAGTSGSGAVERMDTLYSVCQQIGTYELGDLELGDLTERRPPDTEHRTLSTAQVRSCKAGDDPDDALCGLTGSERQGARRAARVL